MKRFVAFLFAIAMLTIGTSTMSRAQESDTTKPAIPMPDTAIVPTQSVTDTTTKKGPDKIVVQPPSQSSEITDRIQNKEKKVKKEKWNLLYRIHMIGHKKREHRAYINQGHHEFYLRTKKDQRRISRHHLNPYKPTKSSKKMQKQIQKSVNKRNDASQKRKKDEAEPLPQTEVPKTKDENVKQEPEPEKTKENRDLPKSEGESPKQDTLKPKLFFVD